MRLALAALIALAACGGARPQPTTTPAAGKPAAAPPVVVAPPAPPPVTGPVAERATQLRRAAELLEDAQRLLDAGERSRAELQFSTAELLTGPDAVAAIAERFRAGGPPRITTPLVTVPADLAPQPATVGNSDDEDDADAAAAATPPPPPRPDRGSLTGTVTVAGAAGALTMVTLEPIDRTWRPRKPKQRIMEQRARQFSPRLMIIPVGSTVAFPNFDPIFHNVFSTSAPTPFDLGLFRQGEARTNTFDREGVLRLGCNIHANMGATIVVVGAPHYVIAGADGGFAFRSLAPGRYRLRAWSERSKAPVTQELVIKSGANQVTVGVDGDAPPGPAPDKYGAPRADR
ncbi:MAG: hypothetical protein R3B06_06605 [Kofleriaceae bacterium]